MKIVIALIAAALLAVLVGCQSGQAAVNVPNKDRVPRKDYASMTVQEKINFINHTPMPQDAKDREIARIRAGGK